MAFLAALAPILTAASAGMGVYSGIKAMTAKKDDKAPGSPAPLPAAPTGADAQMKADADLKKRRRISVLSGGVTDKTRGQALVGEDSVGKKSLLGA